MLCQCFNAKRKSGRMCEPFVRNTHAAADRRAENGREEIAGAQCVNRSSEMRRKMQTLLPNHGPVVRHHRPNIDQARNKLARCDVQPFDRNGIVIGNPRAEKKSLRPAGISQRLHPWPPNLEPLVYYYLIIPPAAINYLAYLCACLRCACFCVAPC